MADLSISLFAADILHMEKELRMLDRFPAYSLHVDIMDGHFVPLYGFNEMWIKNIQRVLSIKKDFHFMAYVTENMLESYMELNPGRMTLHAEALPTQMNQRFFRMLKEAGIEAGVAVSPDSSLELLHPYLGLVDDILVMSAQPGQENSRFLPETYGRISQLRWLLEETQSAASISVDGGLDLEKGINCVKYGADRVIMGRAFFNYQDKDRLFRQIAQAAPENDRVLQPLTFL